jgi:Tfp pilus assembly protein PilN
MNIDINLLPDEVRPKPPISMRMMGLLVVVLVLGYGCYYFYDLKAGTQSETAEVESRIAAIEDQAANMSSNPEAKEVVAEITEYKEAIAELEAGATDYLRFAGTRVEWGEIVQRVSSRIVNGVTLDSIVEGKSGRVEVGGVASGYERAAAFAASIENDELFDNVHASEWNAEKGTFLLLVGVTLGGAE